MMPTAPAVDSRLATVVKPQPEPQTLEDTGLVGRPDHADDSQDAALLRCSHRRCARRQARSEPLVDRADSVAAETHAPVSGDRERRARRALVRLPHHRRGAQPRDPVPRAEPLHRRRARAVRAVPAVHEDVRRDDAEDGDARTRAAGLPAPRAQRTRARSTRSGHQRRALAVRLRPARERQDGHRAGHPEHPRRRHRHPARDRDRRADHPGLRSGRASAHRNGRRRQRHGSRRGARQAMGLLPAADAHRRR